MHFLPKHTFTTYYFFINPSRYYFVNEFPAMLIKRREEEKREPQCSGKKYSINFIPVTFLPSFNHDVDITNKAEE